MHPAPKPSGHPKRDLGPVPEAAAWWGVMLQRVLQLGESVGVQQGFHAVVDAAIGDALWPIGVVLPNDPTHPVGPAIAEIGDQLRRAPSLFLEDGDPAHALVGIARGLCPFA